MKELIKYTIIMLFFLALIFGPWVLKSNLEAAAYNRATGSNVSTWDAMWITLVVQSQPNNTHK
jgi:formate hydrogenlyase subunit 4